MREVCCCTPASYYIGIGVGIGINGICDDIERSNISVITGKRQNLDDLPDQQAILVGTARRGTEWKAAAVATVAAAAAAGPSFLLSLASSRAVCLSVCLRQQYNTGRHWEGSRKRLDATRLVFFSFFFFPDEQERTECFLFLGIEIEFKTNRWGKVLKSGQQHL